MSNRLSPVALRAAVLVAGGYALFRSDSPAPKAEAPFPPATEPAPAIEPDPHASPGALPPNHPPVSGSTSGASAPAASADRPAITWKAPITWSTATNPSTMRIATYKVPHAAGDAEDAEVSVIRAGGTTDANIARWVGQFEDAGKDTRTTKTVRGIKITVVEVSGTYAGGGPMMGAATTAPSGHPKWSLLGAVVETPDMPYFFKMTGPTATVRSARPAFDALLESITPSDG